MKITVLDADTLGRDIDLTPLENFGPVDIYPCTSPAESLDRIRNAEIIITNKVVLDRALISAAPSLKLICVAATGMNNIDLEHARARGVSVRNVAGYSTESVVQMTFSHLMFLLNHHGYYNAFAKNEWPRSGLFTHLGRPFYELAGKRWGIIGLGTIGRRVAQTASAFGCDVVYYSTTGRNKSNDFKRVDLETLLGTCHIVSIHAPLTPRTRSLIDYDGLSRLRDGSILLNLGRGGIVNESDLARILNERPVYAGLDVTEQEPIEAGNPLLRINHPERLSLTPHIAWAGVEARRRLLEGILSNIHDFLDGR